VQAGIGQVLFDRGFERVLFQAAFRGVGAEVFQNDAHARETFERGIGPLVERLGRRRRRGRNSSRRGSRSGR
jgi:hypothetical protein